MAVHHRWAFNITCPICGRTGQIKVIEKADPPFTDAPRREYTPDEGFGVTTANPVTFRCNDCNASIPNPT